jgi:hypothetical protein
VPRWVTMSHDDLDQLALLGGSGDGEANPEGDGSGDDLDRLAGLGAEPDSGSDLDLDRLSQLGRPRQPAARLKFAQRSQDHAKIMPISFQLIQLRTKSHPNGSKMSPWGLVAGLRAWQECEGDQKCHFLFAGSHSESKSVTFFLQGVTRRAKVSFFFGTSHSHLTEGCQNEMSHLTEGCQNEMSPFVSVHRCESVVFS